MADEFPANYPPGSLQRGLYEWGKTREHMYMGGIHESGQEFIARLMREHPEEVSVFIAKWKMGLTNVK